MGVKTLKGLVAWSGCLTHRWAHCAPPRRTSPLASPLSWVGTGGQNMGRCLATPYSLVWWHVKRETGPIGPVSIEKPLDYQSLGLSGSVLGSTLVPSTGQQLTKSEGWRLCRWSTVCPPVGKAAKPGNQPFLVFTHPQATQLTFCYFTSDFLKCFQWLIISWNELYIHNGWRTFWNLIPSSTYNDSFCDLLKAEMNFIFIIDERNFAI